MGAKLYFTQIMTYKQFLDISDKNYLNEFNNAKTFIWMIKWHKIHKKMKNLLLMQEIYYLFSIIHRIK